MTAPDTAVVTVKAEEDLGFMRGKVDEYRSDEDSLADFLAEHVKQSTFATLRHSEMFSRYQAWAKAEGISFAMSSRGLARDSVSADSMNPAPAAAGVPGLESNFQRSERSERNRQNSPNFY